MRRAYFSKSSKKRVAKHSAGNLIFLLVFALLCGDWAEPAKATAAVGGHKALSKLLPDSSKISTETILLAQARNRNGNNGNGSCDLPSGTPGNNGVIRPEDGECVPKNCITSDYTAPKCEDFKPSGGGVGDNNSENPDIGPKGKRYSLSSVEKGETNPTFTGGTLVVDKSVPTTSHNFSVKEVEGNTIDSNGNYVLFKGRLFSF